MSRSIKHILFRNRVARTARQSFKRGQSLDIYSDLSHIAHFKVWSGTHCHLATATAARRMQECTMSML